MQLLKQQFFWVTVLLSTLASLFPLQISAAGATSAEINKAIVLEGSIPLTWENDLTYPWTIISGKLCATKSASVKFKYSSLYPTTISFKHQNNYNNSSQHLYVIVDGQQFYHMNYSASEYSRKFRLPKGNHTVEIKSVLDDAKYSYGFFLWDVKVEECPGASVSEINDAIVMDGSIPLTWILDDNCPWQIIDGKLKTNHYNYDKYTLKEPSSISFKYSSLYPTTVSFKHENNYGRSSQHLYVIVDGEQFYHTYGSSYECSRMFRLPKGNHTVEIKSVLDDASYSYISSLWDVKVEECPGASGSEINNAIVLDSSIPLTWILDEDYPWQIIDGKLKSNHYNYDKYTLKEPSSISFKYSSLYPTTVSFKHENNYGRSSQHLYVIVDGEQFYHTYGSSYECSRMFRLPKGNHTVEIKSVLDDASYSYRSSLWDVKVAEYPGATNDKINGVIVKDGSAPLTWTNDKDFPWRLIDGKLQSSNWGFPNSQSEVAFDYNSNFPTIITFKYDAIGSSSDNRLKVYVDGNFHFSDYNEREGASTIRLLKGNHRIEFCDTVYSNTSFNLYSNIYDVCVKTPECATSEQLNSRFITKSGIPVIWENDTVFPMGYVGDMLQTTNSYWESSKSSLKAHIDVKSPSMIRFSCRVGYNDSSKKEHIARFYVDGVLKYSTYSQTDWKEFSIALPVGEHELYWVYENTTTGANYWMQLKDLSIESEWIEVNSSPGMLGVETLYKVDRLQDVKFLKINGGMNDTDWKVIKQMTNLYGLDLSGADITTFPAAFNANPDFGVIILPNTLKNIPDKAFTTCKIHSILIPASVESIGNEAFASTPLGFINFEANSLLKTIGYKAFYGSNVMEFIMPNSVDRLNTYQYSSSDGYRSEIFANCIYLEKIEFSDALTKLPRYACHNCRYLKDIKFPTNLVEIGSQFMYMENYYNRACVKLSLPATLKTIGSQAFYDMAELKEVNIPGNVTDIGSEAFYRTNLSEINFPESLTYIGSKAFTSCPIESLILPGKLKTIGQEVFSNNSKLKHVLLPSGITDYNLQFSGCANIETIECLCATPPTITKDPFGDCIKSNVTLKVPQFAVATYKLDPYWYQFDPITEGSPTDYWKIIGDLKLLNNRRMEGKPDVDLYYGGKLTVKGDAAMPIGKFDIYTNEANPSSFVTDCTAVTADEINTIFKVDSDKWYFITPMVDVDLQQIIVTGTTNYVFRYYDGSIRADVGAGTSWKNVSDMKLKAGTGYIFQCDKSSEVIFPVPVELHKNVLTTSAVTLPLVPHPSDNKANKGWNYVGNPFPSYYDIHYMDFTAPITVWTGNTYRAYSISDDDFVLRPMQGFFVQKPDAVDVITLRPAGRQIESTVNRNAKAGPAFDRENDRFVFNLEIALADTLIDVTRVVLNKRAAAEYEPERDASKFMSDDLRVPQIFSLDKDRNRLAINELPADDVIEIPLGVYVPESDGICSITATRTDGEAYLYDSETTALHNLADGPYMFSASSGILENRFSIRLKGDFTTGVDQLEDNSEEPEVNVVEGGIEISGVNGSGIQVVTLDGKTIYSGKCEGDLFTVALDEGIYMLVIDGNSQKVVVK